MAVDAHHLQGMLQAGARQQQQQRVADGSRAAVGGSSVFSSARQACYGGGGGGEVVVAGGVVRSLAQNQGYGQHPYMGVVTPAPASVAAKYPRFCGSAVAATESGVTFGGGAPKEVVVASRKRKRADGHQAPALGGAAAPASDVAAHVHHQLQDVDRLVLHHAARMSAELAEQRRRHARQMVAAVEAAAARRLRAKDEEIERITSLNWALEERLKGLYVEAQVWRDLAQSNESAATVLRGELEQALDAQARYCAGVNAGSIGGGEEDAESCCGENDNVSPPARAGAGEEAEDEVGTSSADQGGGRCKGCGKGAAVVLFLPCRHLCSCLPCAIRAEACPACGCAKNGSLCVNFS